jgi:hypothetical protein
MPGVEGPDQFGAKLFEYPVKERSDGKINFYLIPVIYVPLLILLYVYWPMNETCFVLMLIAFIFGTIFILTPILPGESPVIEVHENKMRVENMEFHPTALEYVETYYDHGHFGGKTEKSPHFVFIFHWKDRFGSMRSHERPWRLSREAHAHVIDGLQEAVPWVRIVELPEKNVRLRK